MFAGDETVVAHVPRASWYHPSERRRGRARLRERRSFLRGHRRLRLSGRRGGRRRPPPRDTSRRDPNASRRPSPPRAPPTRRRLAIARGKSEGVGGKTDPRENGAADAKSNDASKTTTFGAVFPLASIPSVPSRFASRVASRASSAPTSTHARTLATVSVAARCLVVRVAL